MAHYFKAIGQDEETLHSSEARYRAIVEDQSELICCWRPDTGTFSFVNQAYCRYYNQKAEDLLEGRVTPYTILEEERNTLKEYYASLAQSKQPGNIEHRVMLPTGEIRWQSWTDRPLFDKRGRLVEFQSVGHDITEQKQAEAALQKYAERLEILRQIDRAILAARSPQDIAGAALSQLARLITPYHHANVSLFDSQYQTIVTLASYHQGEVIVGKSSSMPVSQTTLNPESLRQGILHQVADYRALEGLFPQFQAILTTLEIRATLAAPLVTAGELIGLVGLARKEPGLFAPEEIEILQEVANSLAIAMQHARLFEAEREQRLQAETLREVTLALTAQIELEAVLDEILLQVKRVVPYRTANIALLQKGTLHVVREQGYARWGNNNSITGMVQPLAEAPLDRRTVETGQPVVVHDSRQEPEWVWYPQTPWIRSHLMVPIHWHNRVTGILRLDGAEPGEFNLEDARRLMPLAAAAGIALENARLYQLVQHHAEELEQRVVERTEELREQYQKQAVLEERQRLARDLHDAVSQTLFSASLLAEAIPRLWERQPEQAKTSLGELHRLNRGALAEMRTLLLELRPTALTEANLKDLLQQLANGLASNSKLTIALSLVDEPNVPVGIKIVFYRIAQESLNNITKHARASQVLVALKSQPGQVKLTIEDDGRGFDSKELSAGHFGLNIMRERAKSIGAKFQLSSQPGEGTKVNITWPDET